MTSPDGVLLKSKSFDDSLFFFMKILCVVDELCYLVRERERETTVYKTPLLVAIATNLPSFRFVRTFKLGYYVSSFRMMFL